MPVLPRLSVAATLVLAATTAVAQPAPQPSQSPQPVTIELGLQGDVMVSTGGEFVQAVPGQALQPGHRVLVAEGASANATYGNGCSKSMAAPGVYTVSADCQFTGNRPGMSQGAVIGGLAAGVAVIAAAAGGGGGSDSPPPPPPPPPPPVSR